jgi:hypothetical protein
VPRPLAGQRRRHRRGQHGIFRRSSAGARGAAEPAPPSVPVPRLHGDQQGLAFEAQLGQGQWKEFHDFLESMSDWETRQFYITELSRISGRPEWLDEWAAAKPGSSLPVLFRGSHGINWAWEARGAGRAKNVAEDAWPLFHRRLVEADQAPHAKSVTVARGLSLGPPEVKRRFEQAHRRQALNGPACTQALQGLARKWGGSHAAMFDFARWASGQAPDGHSAHKLIALAHIEMWLDAEREQRLAYFNAEPVKQEVWAAARRSILSPDYRCDATVLSWAERNIFAFCWRWTVTGSASARPTTVTAQMSFAPVRTSLPQSRPPHQETGQQGACRTPRPGSAGRTSDRPAEGHLINHDNYRASM